METRANNRVHIGNVIRQGIVFDFKNLRPRIVNTDPLLQTVASLLMTQFDVESSSFSFSLGSCVEDPLAKA